MCGRFGLITAPETLAERFGVEAVPALEPRYNIAPTQGILAIRRLDANVLREATMLRWGLIPPWSDGPGAGPLMINARAESIADRPAYRQAFRRRRCLVPADGFYEWKRQGRSKVPFYIRMRDGRPFAMAGLWERWDGPDGTPVESCAIVTTAANELVRAIHDRMPVILRPEDYEAWLDPAVNDPGRLRALLWAYASSEMESWGVGRYVNDPYHDDPDCIRPLENAFEGPFFDIAT